MSASTDTLAAGSVYRFKLVAKKDGSTWDLTGATVKLYLWPTDRPSELTTVTATLADDPTTGVATAVNPSATFTNERTEQWQRQWEVTVAGVPYRYNASPFVVSRSAAT